MQLYVGRICTVGARVFCSHLWPHIDSAYMVGRRMRSYGSRFRRQPQGLHVYSKPCPPAKPLPSSLPLQRLCVGDGGEEAGFLGPAVTTAAGVAAVVAGVAAAAAAAAAVCDI